MCLDHSTPVETGIFASWLLVCTYSMISGLNQELSMLLNFFSLFSFHLECRERERENRCRELPSSGSSPLVCNSPVGWAEPRNPEIHPGLPYGWLGPNLLGHHQLPPRAHLQEAVSEVE